MQKAYRRNTEFWSAILLAGTGIGSATVGQAAPASTSVGLEEVIVTAQKREEFLQQTPIAMAALDAKVLENTRVSDLVDLRGAVPNLSVAPFAGDRGAPVLFIRGMGGTDVQTTKDGAVGVYLDGVLLGRASGMATDIADLERVEVLRGPQGTLYGRNTTGGAINFITRKPEQDFSLKQELSAGNYDYRASKTSVDIPLTERLFTTLAYMYSRLDGWVANDNKQLSNQVDFNEEEKKAGKVAIRLLATDDLTLDYSYDTSTSRYGNSFYQAPGGQDVPRQEHKVAMLGSYPSNVNVDGHNFTVTWDIDDVTLKAISGYRTLKNSTFQNFIDAFSQFGSIDQHQFSQELQAVGDWSDNLNYVAGLYYYEEKSDSRQTSMFGFTPYNDTWRVKAESKSTAAYGQSTWTPPVLDSKLQVTLGLRFTRDVRHAEKYFLSNLFTGPVNPATVVDGNKTFSKFNPSLTFNYGLSSDINLYAKVVSGYRAGGFNSRSTLAGFGEGFNQENVWSYEAGLKSYFLDNRIRFNVATFLNKYSDLQVDQVRPGLVFTDTVNAGRATIKGAEFELDVRATEALTFNMFYTYLDAEFDKYVDNGQDLASVKSVPYAPKDAGRVGLQYDFMPTPLGRPVLNVDYQRQGRTYSGPNSDTLNDSYGIWNARLQLVDIPLPKGSLKLALWGKNLSDKEYTVTTTNLGVVSAVYGTPRTYGVDAIFEY